MTVESNATSALANLLKSLMEVEDNVWGYYAFSRDILSNKFTVQEIKRLTDHSNHIGEKYAEEILMSHSQSNLKAIIENKGIKIRTVNEEASMSQFIVGQFIPPREIILYQEVIKKVKGLFVDSSLREVMDIYSLEDIILAHELFHYMETVDAEKIFTRQYKKELWKFGPFQYKVSVRALSEIAAMSFSKKVNHLDYSPFILDLLILHSYDKNKGYQLYHEMKSMEKIVR